MAATPKRVKVEVNLNHPQVKRALDVAYREGLKKGRLEVLDFLETAYLKAPDRPDRSTPRGEAILQVARDAAAHFREVMTREKKR